MSIAFVDCGTTHFLSGSGFITVCITGLMMTNIRYRQADINHETIQDVLLPFNTMGRWCMKIRIYLTLLKKIDPANFTKLLNSL